MLATDRSRRLEGFAATQASITDFVRDELKRQEMTHLELALLSGHSTTTIWKIVRGIHNVRLGSLSSVAHALGYRARIVFERVE